MALPPFRSSQLRLTSRLWQAAAWTAAIVVSLAVLLLLLRALAGAIIPLPLPFTFSLVLLACLAALACRYPLHRRTPELGLRGRLGSSWISAVLLAFVVGLLGAHFTGWALAALAVAVACELGSWWLLLGRPKLWERAAPWMRRRSPPSAAQDLVTQQLRRRQSETEDVIDVELRVPWAAGQQTDVVHLAFCPPLEHAPQFTVRQTSGSPVTLRATEQQTYGVRWELRSASPPAAAEVVAFSVTARAPRQRRTVRDNA